MEMFVFFTIPAIFIIMMILIPLAIGASALQFILDHIVIISIIIWLPVAWGHMDNVADFMGMTMTKKWSVYFCHFFWFRCMLGRFNW